VRQGKPIDPNELVRLYVLERLSKRKVAAQLAIGVDRVGEELRKLGIPLRSYQQQCYADAERDPEYRERRRRASAQIDLLRQRNGVMALPRRLRRRRKFVTALLSRKP
jgi:hypothetical protein